MTMTTKHRLLAALALAMLLPLLATLPTAASAQTKGTSIERRIKFARGRTSTTVKGYINDRLTTHLYLVGARAGQTLSVQISSSKAVDICVVKPDGSSPDNSCGRSFTGELTVDGDYSIIVDSKRENTSYVLTVSVK